MKKDNKGADILLVRRAKKGDFRAFDLLVTKYQAKIISISHRLVKDINIAEDMAQETFIKAYKVLDSFREESAFYTWIYRIAVNTSKNYLISRGRSKENTESEMHADFSNSILELEGQDSPEDLLLADNLKDLINAELNDLPEEIRTSLTLREYEGLSYAEISNILDCPVGTVRSRIFRGREVLSQAIKENILVKKPINKYYEET